MNNQSAIDVNMERAAPFTSQYSVYERPAVTLSCSNTMPCISNSFGHTHIAYSNTETGVESADAASVTASMNSSASAQQTILRCGNVVTTLCFGCHNVVN